MRTLHVLMMLIGTTLLVGCGGGGGGPVYSGGGTTPATHLRSPLPGDTYNYTLSGKLQAIGTNVSYSFTGNLVIGFSQTNYNGASVLLRNSALTLNLSNGQTLAVNEQEIESSDSSGDLVGLANIQNGTVDPLSPPVITAPAAWSNALSIDQQTTTSFGISYVDSFTVVGAENVSTPIGTFACWKVNFTSNSSSSSNTNETIWYAPEMGDAPIKESGTTTIVASDGNTYTATINSILSSTNVPIS
ncbi:MAG TPA: hypothetical protein VKV18_03580 [Chthonomonas sp.]|uniref:TapB family protein n=1 Tax=Chthonomonas sp. TaxID=2282153 RepID=UPI002B4B2FA2|nr:hypothetical protein [Chthonomonas sp.]HLI47759.1 hypothetical protein [Chthonomonas sp.]